MQWISKFAAVVLVSLPAPAHAQTRGFIVRLGADTFAVERFTRNGNSVNGAVVRHTPVTTILRYSITFNRDSSIANYRESIVNPDGNVVQPELSMTFAGDSVTREVIENGQRVLKRNAAPGVTMPAVGGTSPYWQELAVQAIRRTGANQFGFYGFGPAQNSPNTFETKIVGTDSAEIIFNQGFHRGFKLNRRGELIHGDATNTTVRLQLTPIRDADIAAIARKWAANDAAGKGMGTPSTRDTVRATLGAANVAIDYGRPAKRGRVIWGKLVPLDTVWRLGANFPTTLTTDKPLDIGGTSLPAGSYSLWLVPSAGQSFLLVNTQTQGWVGVPMHDAAQDFAKIAVRKHSGKPAGEERFRIRIENGKLMMLWDDGGYEVLIRG